MNAIRRDEDLDNLHSVYVDQWDWEKIITVEDRNETYLKNEMCIRDRDRPPKSAPRPNLPPTPRWRPCNLFATCESVSCHR